MRETRVAASKLGFGSDRAAEDWQRVRGVARKALALRVDEAARCPARERHVLFDVHFQAIGPDAAHRGPAYPGQALECRAQLIDRRGEEVSAADLRQGRPHVS